MTIALRSQPAAPTHRGVGSIYRWELEKLTAQWRVRIAVLTCLLGPFAATAVLDLQQQTPSDTLFGRWVHTSGSAIPLLILSFAAQYAIPLLTGLVAGDIFASEDRYGTWKMILTRRSGRTAIFWAKTLAAGTYTVLVMVLLVLSSTAAGLLIVGHQSLVGLSGTLIPAGHATGLVFWSWASALPPALGFTALGLLFSVVTRHGTAGIIAPVVIGGLMEVYALVGTAEPIRVALLATSFDSWHGLFQAHPFYRPLIQDAITSGAYIAVCLTAALLVLRRRDITEG
jgi:ABC-2 type transport system permease protein